MTSQSETRSGAEVLIDALKINAVERIFCIPGESFLAALDALYDRSEIELIVCRNEGGAAYMAEAEGKLTNKPGVCFVTRGPGATNASGGLHVAMQDSTPMILLIGQIARKDLDREAFQEIDYRRMFSEIAKWVAQIDDADRIPEYLNRAPSASPPAADQARWCWHCPKTCWSTAPPYAMRARRRWSRSARHRPTSNRR